MKTKIGFTINSEEITKEINEVVLAEAKNYCREYAKNAYKTQIEERVQAVLSGKVNTELSPIIKKAIEDAVSYTLKEIWKNDEKLQELLLVSVNNYTRKVQYAVEDYLKKLDKCIIEINENVSKQVNDKVEAVLNEKLFSAFLSMIVKGGDNEA